MSQPLSGKTALITGAASGIGAATAVALARAGADVLLADIVNPTDTLDAVEKHTRAEALVCDVADEASIGATIEKLDSFSNPISIVINSAGILIESGVDAMDVGDFDRLMAVNLRGTFLLGKHLLPLLRDNGTGRFIAVASELAISGREGFSAYCASKAGVIGLVRSWAREFAPEVLVNALAPGPVDTPMLDLGNMSPEWRDKESDIPLERVATPEEIAAVALFLAGPDSSFMTGQTVSPNGGAVMF